jgi:parvulin-like peptidyl-prolyl isomerase
MEKVRIHRKHRFGTLALCLLIGGIGMARATVAQEPPASPARAVFATVAGTVITQDDYANALIAAARSKFYHGKPPEGEVARLQRDVADKMVARVLLLREAERLGLQPDAAEVARAVQGYEQRYANSERWQQNRAQLLPGLVARLEQDDVLARLEKEVRGRARPDSVAAEAYYRSHPEKFTQPEQLRVSLIMLKVDPSAPASAWATAEEEARAIVKRLRDGADMAELARLHSSDASAKQGGDLGYLHAGMLPGGAEEVLKTMQPGQLGEPLRVLEGVAIVRLIDRKLAGLVTFESAKARAEELQLAEQKDALWEGFVAQLRKQTPAQIDESLFFPLAAPEQGSVK